MYRKILQVIFVFFLFNQVQAQISISAGSTITEPFSISTISTASLPANWRIDNINVARTLGTYSSASTTTTQVGGNSMSSSAGNGRYNFGAGVAASATDRAVGGLSSSGGSASVNVYAFLQNTGSNSIGSLNISYSVEKYRQGTNAAGYRIQMFYSTDGSTWTDAGSNFLTSYPADATTAGYTNAPGVTTAVSNTLTVTIPVSGNLYLAWNYSVSSGSTSTNSQALGIDDVSVTAAAACDPQVLIADVTHVTCNGTSNGEIDLTASGGSLPVISYAWTGPGGYTANTEDITALAAGSYLVTVTATGGCTAAGNFEVNEPNAIVAIATLDAPIECVGGSTSITVSGSGGVEPYDGIGSFSVTPGDHAYTITDANGCSVLSNSVNVVDGTGVAPLKPESPLFGPTQHNLCAYTSFFIAVPNDPTATFYTWTIPLGFDGSSTTNSINITPNVSTYNKVTFPVTATNNCGTSPVRNVNIYGQPSKPEVEEAPCFSAFPVTGLVFNVNNPDFGATYIWSVPNNVIIQSGQGTSSITVDWNRNTGGRIKVQGSNSCGVSPFGRFDIALCPNATALGVAVDKSFIYPNPTSGNTFLLLNTERETKYTILVVDMSGRYLLRNDVVASVGQNKITLNTASLAKGVYVISVRSGDSIQQFKLIKE